MRRLAWTATAVGPFRVSAAIQQLTRVLGNGELNSNGSVVILNTPVYGHLWPVYTSRYAVLQDASDVVWAQVTIDNDDYYVFLHPNDTDSYVRSVSNDTYIALTPSSSGGYRLNRAGRQPRPREAVGSKAVRKPRNRFSSAGICCLSASSIQKRIGHNRTTYQSWHRVQLRSLQRRH